MINHTPFRLGSQVQSEAANALNASPAEGDDNSQRYTEAEAKIDPIPYPSHDGDHDNVWKPKDDADLVDRNDSIPNSTNNSKSNEDNHSS
jgi:hypothetical protein